MCSLFSQRSERRLLPSAAIERYVDRKRLVIVAILVDEMAKENEWTRGATQCLLLLLEFSD